MPKLIVADRLGGRKSVDAREGASAMEAIRDNGFDVLPGLCGGCCSCATCHILADED